MAELWGWARSRAFRRAPNSTAMPVRVTQRSQDQQPNANEALHNGSVQNVKLYNPLADVRRTESNASCPAPEKKRTKPMKPAESEGNPCSAVYRRPYRDRVIHLLALRTYKKPELLARLQRDGVMQKDKGTLGKMLQQVANWNPKDNSFSLKEHLFQTLQTDWPGYSKTDRENLKLILSRKTAPSQNPTGGSQATSPGPSERDAPARPAQKWPLASDFTSPLMSKKRRIGHQHSHIQPAAGGHFSSLLLPSTSLFTMVKPPSVGSISPCTPVVQQTEKFQSSSIPEPARVQKEIPNSNGKKNELGRLQQFCPLDFNEGNREDTSIASTCSATSNQPDYLRKYIAIVSLEQCQRYKDDFNAEYEEYRNLHSQIDNIIKKFRQFQEQWKSLTPGSEAYQTLHHRILADYQQLQQGSPSYSEMKSRCQYLHKKLSHIQSCISEFDQQ
ncbi:RNA polymerase II elongation factor ELL2-like isoform X2 [Vidua chalybeata]|uniref:RNA polymerase II elongation factor ELL2-like isoform X2 n=1 Tax=Vidua chalybeata TaxID=81927 RepID=UPI0023A7F910|nr:RNA polymerase II elongation factor ELL2-like isoform X2 [Vidua chalybeata]